MSSQARFAWLLIWPHHNAVVQEPPGLAFDSSLGLPGVQEPQWPSSRSIPVSHNEPARMLAGTNSPKPSERIQSERRAWR
jgi:hypothetical protein